MKSLRQGEKLPEVDYIIEEGGGPSYANMFDPESIPPGQDPDVEPCYKCGRQMYIYEESNDPRLNICDECKGGCDE